MKEFDYKRKGRNRFKNFFLILLVLFIFLGITYGVYKLFFIPAPVVEGTEAFNLLPADKTIVLKAKNIKSLDIVINQGDKSIELLRDMSKSLEKTYTLQIKPKDLNFTDGSASVIVKARSGILKDVKYEISSIIDTVPPTIEVLKAPYSIYQGNGGFALLASKNADSVFIKLVDPAHQDQSLEDSIFKAFKSPSGPDSESVPRYFVFFPAPFDINDNSVFYAVAKDSAGNKSIKALPTKLKTKSYNTSSINISDSFIKTVIYPLLNETDTSNPVESFKKINEEWRKDNSKKLLEISQGTGSEILWEGHFLQLKNTKVMATYGDKRTYIYNGETIGKSAHLGYDLASTENAMVEAANSGVVRFAGDLGIYGNTVIIDHGLGLMSLYGHLSTIIVKEGHEVEKGEIIAKTGSTGFAGGDHLHFGIIIHGYEVSPLPWWDPHWVKVNVLDYLEGLEN